MMSALMKSINFLILTIFIFLVPEPAEGEKIYSCEKSNTVIGTVKTYRVKAGESLIEIARTFGLGYNEIVDANPAFDPFVPGKDVTVTLPSSWILPHVRTYEGIVINLSELRLYYFFKQKRTFKVMTFPIGIGSEGFDTPVGEFRVFEKIAGPAWYVPESIRKEKPDLPRVMPPGPDNPLGSHALRLSLKTILIHGTNKPWGVGRGVSHGCIRLYPEDIPKLFRLVTIGMRVTIVRQPVKVGITKSKVYVEVHKDGETKDGDYYNETISLLMKQDLRSNVSTEKLSRAIERKQGMPVDISK